MLKQQVSEGDTVVYKGSKESLHGLKCSIVHIPGDPNGRGYVLYISDPSYVPNEDRPGARTLSNVHRDSFELLVANDSPTYGNGETYDY